MKLTVNEQNITTTIAIDRTLFPARTVWNSTCLYTTFYHVSLSVIIV